MPTLTALRSRVPLIRGTRCPLCSYEVPALGLVPDDELAWFERFEGKLCPNCCGLAIGLVAGAVLTFVLERGAGRAVRLAIR